MTLTAEQLTLRRQGIGASEAAAVLGLSPWRSPADVYWSKVADPEPDKPTEAMARGIALEPYILDRVEQDLGIKLNRDAGTITDPISGVLMATPDALVIGAEEAIEVKTASDASEWGEHGTDAIPECYLIQTHHQMAVLNRAGYAIKRVLVPVLIFGFRAEYRLYRVERNESLEAAITAEELAWWNRHVVARTPPTNDPPPIEVLKRLRREPKSQVILGANGVEAWQALEVAKEAEKLAKETKDQAQAAVLALLGIDDPAESALLPDGRLITYLSQRSAPSVDTDQLKARWPDAYAACVTQGTHRVLRIKKPK